MYSDPFRAVSGIGGTGPVVNDLEWDIKTYFALNAAVHDAACLFEGRIGLTTQQGELALEQPSAFWAWFFERAPTPVGVVTVAPGAVGPRYDIEAVASRQIHSARSVSVSNSRTMCLSCRSRARRSTKRRSSPGT